MTQLPVKDKQHSEGRSWNYEEVEGNQVLEVVVQESPPSWRRRLSVPYLATVDRETLMPILAGSLRIRGAPQVGLDVDIFRIKARTSRSNSGVRLGDGFCLPRNDEILRDANE